MTKLLSWGRYPPRPQVPHAVHWRDEAAPRLAGLAGEFGSTLAYGNGRSYGDSCLAASGHVLHTRGLDRLVAADWKEGRITVEAGMTLGELLAFAVPRGWFLPVTPGTRLATVAGAVANDVHGKNHHVRGTFGRHVRALGLTRSRDGTVRCGPQENGDLFRATVGGLGLTGLMEWVDLQLMPVKSAFIRSVQRRFASLDGYFELSAEHDPRHEYTVAWVDCLAAGASLGRGVFFAGDHAETGALTQPAARPAAVPFTPPVSAVNGLTLRVFNAVYYATHGDRSAPREVPYEPFFYPLDRIAGWNRLYGPAGFQQYQCVIPEPAARPAMREMLAAIAAAGRGSFLAVLKRCGDIASPGLLSFPMPGISLALDFPQHALLHDELFPRLDAIVRSAGGRLYPAKDAHMTAADFRAGYPQWTQLEALRDPAFCSQFWKRVALE